VRGPGFRYHPGIVRTVHEAAGGEAGLLRLALAWHANVMADEVVSHAFSHGFHPKHSERLAAYWAEALGGPRTYSAAYGAETSVVRMHSGNGPHEEMDRRAIACFDQALADVGLADDDRVRQVLHDYFAWATTTTMSRYHRSADDVPGRAAHSTLVMGRTRQQNRSRSTALRNSELARGARADGRPADGAPQRDSSLADEPPRAGPGACEGHRRRRGGGDGTGLGCGRGRLCAPRRRRSSCHEVGPGDSALTTAAGHWLKASQREARSGAAGLCRLTAP